MRKTKKPLSLDKESLRLLASRDLVQARGGVADTGDVARTCIGARVGVPDSGDAVCTLSINK